MPELVKQYVTQEAQKQAPSLIDQVLGFLPLLAILIIAFIIIIIFVKWYFNRKEMEKEIYHEEYRKRIHECLVCKNNKFINSVAGLPRFLASKGVPVFIRYPKLTHTKEYYKIPKKVRTKEGEKPKDGEIAEELTIESGESYLLGNYAGHSIGTDGCYNLMIKSARDKTLGIFPKLLIIKIRLPHKQKTIDANDRKKTKVDNVPPDMADFSSDTITLNALGLEKINEYWYLVNMDGEGNIVDNKQYVYNDLIDIATQKQVIDMGRNMAKAVDEMVKSNSIVQFLKKTDSSLGQD